MIYGMRKVGEAKLNRKQNMRDEIIKHLLALPEPKRQQIEKELLNQFIHSDSYKKSQVIGITISQKHEWETQMIIEQAWKDKKTVCVPLCVTDSKTLIFYQLDDFIQLKSGHFNLLEPEAETMNRIDKQIIDLLVVPGIVFDQNNYRIGHGGGYYDRFLENYQGESISLFHECQLVDNIPVEPFDIPVNKVIIARN